MEWGEAGRVDTLEGEAEPSGLSRPPSPLLCPEKQKELPGGRGQRGPGLCFPLSLGSMHPGRRPASPLQPSSGHATAASSLVLCRSQ